MSVREKCVGDQVSVSRADLMRIRSSMVILQKNSEGCAANHYGNDHEIHGMPGWLADTKRDVQALTDMLGLGVVKGGADG